MPKGSGMACIINVYDVIPINKVNFAKAKENSLTFYFPIAVEDDKWNYAFLKIFLCAGQSESGSYGGVEVKELHSLYVYIYIFCVLVP